MITREAFFNFIALKNERPDSRMISHATDKYMKLYDKHISQAPEGDLRFFASWNWAAFFFSHIWFFYRKMYLYGFIVVAIQVALFALTIYDLFGTGMINDNILIQSSLPFPLQILIGMLSNYIYFRFAVSEINKGVTTKGTSFWGVILGLLISLLTNMNIGVEKLQLSHDSSDELISSVKNDS